MKTHALPEGSMPWAALSHCPAAHPHPQLLFLTKVVLVPGKLVYLQNFIHSTVEEGAYKAPSQAHEKVLQMPFGNILLEYILYG